MTLFAEFHLIQNFAPANLNRDDTGAPKDAMFGGWRRARVSSQCFKRAMRMHAAQALPADACGVRTKRLHELLVKSLAGKGRADPGARIRATLDACKLSLDENGMAQYLLFLGRREIDAFATLIDQHWDALAPGDGPAETGKRTKKQAKAAAPEAVVKAAPKLLDGGKAVDVAMFGRMLADLPGANQHAACQVAHAISTHKVDREFDYFTAVDDEAPADEPSVGMIDQVEFNSATFYRYAVVDVDKLLCNLQADRKLMLQGLAAFADAMARALPTGKQNSFAAHNVPAFVGFALRHASPFNLANAFEKPVIPRRETALSALSVEALADHEQRLAALYGDPRDRWALIDDTGAWPASLGDKKASLRELVDWLRDEVAKRLPPPAEA